MKIKKGQEYTGDELEELGYEINPRCFIIIPTDIDSKDSAYGIVDIGNDNYEIIGKLRGN